MFSKHTTCLLLSTFGVAVLMAAITSNTTTGDNMRGLFGDSEESRGQAEPFAECVYRPANKHIFSVTVERINHQVVVEEQAEFISETLIHERQPHTYPAVAYVNEYQQD